MSGAICGASLSIVKDKDSGIGALAGGVAAIVSAYGFYYLRHKLGEATEIPDVLIGLAEDVIVVKGGQSILK